MSKEKEDKEAKKSANEDIQKSLDANWALTRRIKDWLEKIYGADIDGDGHIGPWKAAILAILLSASQCFGVSQSTNTRWNVTDTTGTNDLVQVDKDGNLKIDGTVDGDVAQSVITNDNISASANISLSKIATTTQYDTNATTSVTTKTPAAIGQILYGAVGSSGRVWRASGTTTNDWVLILSLP